MLKYIFLSFTLLLSACNLNDEPNDISGIVESVSPTVVMVETEVVKTEKGRIKKGTETGAGIWVGENLVLTNAHVADDAKFPHYISTSYSFKKFAATVIQKDDLNDIALLKINDWDTFKKEGYPTKIAKFRSSFNLKRGEPVFSMGHPWGLEYTVSRGIISYANRAVPVFPEDRRLWIQTDANVFNGNSGGPLFDFNGNVLGINTIMLAGGPGGSFGLALTADFVKKVYTDLLYDGKVDFPLIGIMMKNKPNEEYIIVESVLGEAPAGIAGIQVGDKLVSFSAPFVTNQPIIDVSTFRCMIALLNKGDILTIKVNRGGKIEDIPIAI
jgi:serine protease Do